MAARALVVAAAGLGLLSQAFLLPPPPSSVVVHTTVSKHGPGAAAASRSTDRSIVSNHTQLVFGIDIRVASFAPGNEVGRAAAGWWWWW
jgi:hypothetical protein